MSYAREEPPKAANYRTGKAFLQLPGVKDNSEACGHSACMLFHCQSREDSNQQATLTASKYLEENEMQTSVAGQKIMSKQIKIASKFCKCYMPDLEQSTKNFFHQEEVSVSPQRSKSVFSNKNRFLTWIQLSSTLFILITLVCLIVSILSQCGIIPDLLQKVVFKLTKSMAYKSGRIFAWSAELHTLLSLNVSSLSALHEQKKSTIPNKSS